MGQLATEVLVEWTVACLPSGWQTTPGGLHPATIVKAVSLLIPPPPMGLHFYVSSGGRIPDKAAPLQGLGHLISPWSVPLSTFL
jgi:hypothetical protein